MEYLHYPQKGSIRFGKIAFSETELKDLALAWVAISLAFGFIIPSYLQTDLGFFQAFLISLLTVGIGFIFHELGHKVIAQRYGAWAEFRAWKQMLIFAVILAYLVKVIFAAPGAVMIAGRTIGKSRNGKISAMGPFINFIIAALFIPLVFLFPGTIFSLIGKAGAQINTWLGLFNLIPFAMFDGKKIFQWNKGIYAGLVVIGFVLMLSQSII